MQKKAALIALIALFVGLTPFIVEYTSVDVFKAEYNSTATVTNYTLNSTQNIGVVTGQNLEFGRLPLGTASVKYLNMSSSKPALMTMEMEGNISDHIRYSDELSFQGEKRTTLRFNATEPGYYEGTLKLKIQTPKNRIGEVWLDLKSQL